MFPEEVPRRLIKMFSFVNDTVLDPFLGSGTTSLAAKKLDRHSIGYEINPEFLPMIKNKIGTEQRTIFEEADFEIVHQNMSSIDYKEVAKHLPYVFRDAVRFDKKVDPRKLRFGSRIDNDDPTREKYYSVKDVISPEQLVIGDGLKVRLLGVRSRPRTRTEAIEFLRDRIRGQKVFMKFDAIKHDADNNLLCYLYLQNKTFLNAHLIKRGLVDVDTSIEYKLRSKFLEARKG